MCLWTQVRPKKKRQWSQIMLTFVLLHLFLQFVWPIWLNWQLNFPVWINMQCYAIFHCCKVHVKLVLFHLQSIFATIVGLCTYSSNPTMLLLVEKKNVFEPEFAMYKNTHKHSSLYRKLLGVPWDDYCFERFNVFFDLLPEKDIPPETEHWENTLQSIPHASQSFDHHGSLLKINGDKKKSLAPDFFRTRGKLCSQYHKTFSLPISPQNWQHRVWCLQ